MCDTTMESLKRMKEKVAACNKELATMRLKMLDLRSKVSMTAPNISDLLEQEILVKTELAEFSNILQKYETVRSRDRSIKQ